MARRIIPVSSGKGGVGKTTFAINYALALSRLAPTILVDLDTGTSSVRNTLNVPIQRDLYHFHRRGVPLEECITALDAAHDPHGRFVQFGFIAGPQHYIQELSNPSAELRRRLAAEINRLPADYVVVDLRAGLDAPVVDFLPYTNSGVLLFTPHHPAACLAASDIVKAILFRSLRILFGRDSRFYDAPGMGRYHDLIHALLNRVEDVYEPSLPHLDAFLMELAEAFGDHPILHALADVLDDFRVHYVLNMFDGVAESYEGAIVPFIKNLAENVSARLHLTQLGWIVFDPEVHRANCEGFPILLDRPGEPAEPPVDRVFAELEAIAAAARGHRRRRRTPRPARPTGERRFELPQAEDALAGQLHTLRTLYEGRHDDTVRDNFAYVTYRSLQLMAPPMASTEFGQTRLMSPEELTRWFLSRRGRDAE